MADDLLPLDMGKAPKRKSGPARAAVEAALKAWREAGHLIGPADAARRRVLRDSADAVDAASSTMHGRARCKVCGSADNDGYAGSPGGLAYANNIHAQLLASVQPAAAPTDADPYSGGTDADDFDTLAAAWLSSPSPGDTTADPGL
jgi:hypothetical protein